MRRRPPAPTSAATLLQGLLAEETHEVQGRQQMVWAFENLVRGLAREGPVVLALEDFHFADVDDVRLLCELVRRTVDARVGFVVASRRSARSTSELTRTMWSRPVTRTSAMPPS
mgnify:CR=1 FL=1